MDGREHKYLTVNIDRMVSILVRLPRAHASRIVKGITATVTEHGILNRTAKADQAKNVEFKRLSSEIEALKKMRCSTLKAYT
jgi:hypothetical protein